MKKLLLSVLCLTLSLSALFLVSGCGNAKPKPENKLSFKTLTVGQKNIDGNVPVYGKVPNVQKTYSFIDEVKIEGNVQYVVSLDIYGIKQVATKTIPLTEGDNLIYITEQINGNPKTIYEVTIRRRPMYSVVFDTDGGTILDSQQIEEGTVITAPAAPTKTGYTFNGWYAYNLPDSSEDFDPSLPVIGTTAATFPYRLDNNVAFYAIFTPNVYTATFNVNGGKPLASETQNVTYDTPFIPAAAERDGYTFVGWKDDEGNLFKSLVQWKYDYPVTFTAQWLLNTYEIIYNLNGGTNNKNNPATYTIESDTVTLVTPARTAYSFAGWFTDRNFTNEITEIVAGSFGNKTVYAKWTPVVYDIIYELDGGANDENNPTTYTVETPTIEFAAPSKTGYTFNGWYAEKDFSGDNVTELPQGNYGNVTLYAKWTANKYTITYLDTKLITDVTDATKVNSSSSRLSVTTENEPTSIYAIVGENGKHAIYYANYYSDKSFITIVNLSTGKTLKARTTCSSSYNKVEFYASVGDVIEIVIEKNSSSSEVRVYFEGFTVKTAATALVYSKGETYVQSVTYDKNYDLINYERTGYAKTGWFNGDEKFDGGIWNLTDDVTLYADWQIVTYNITYVLNGGDTIGANPTEYNIESQDITLANPTGKHTFVGWYKDEALKEKITVIANHSFGDITLYADWQHETATDWVIDKAPTCTNTGLRHKVCSVCGVNYNYETIATVPTAHVRGEEVKENVIDPTCTKDGSYDVVVYCTECNKELRRVRYAVPMVDHNLDENNVCAICGKSSSDGLSFTLKGDVYELTSIGTCTDINILIPNTYQNKSVTSIGSSAFKNCSTLIKITIPDSVTSIGDSAFSGCYSLTSIIIPDSITSIGNYAFDNCIGLTSITIGNGVTSISYGAFSYCIKLTNIIISNSVTSIGNSAFSRCSGLTSITIPDSVTSISDSAFQDCNGLTSAIIGNGVTFIGNSVFRGCSGLTSVTIGNGVTSIGSWTFSGCSKLTNVEVANGNNKYHSQNNCIIETATKILIIGCNNSVIPNDGSVTSIGEYAFSGCYSLTSIIIPDSITSIGGRAFIDCSGLTNITIPNGVTSIGSWTFSGCSGLTSVTIPDSVTSIGYGAFADCSGLTSVTIGSGITSIGSAAFLRCSKLTNITFNGTKEQWSAIILDRYWNDGVPASVVHCTDGDISIK